MTTDVLLRLFFRVKNNQCIIMLCDVHFLNACFI
jgi:hypothetical protein